MSQLVDDPIDPGQIERDADLRRSALGASVNYYESIGSTNDAAVKAAVAGAAHGTVVIANQQLSGRGRHGRVWHSPAGQNLYMSVVLRPPHTVERLAPIPLVMGLAVCDIVSDMLDIHRVGLKWPNDVLVGTHKLAGILVDSALSGSFVDYTVVGIGLNVHQKVFDSSIASIATSLAKEGVQELKRTQLATRILSAMEARLTEFDAHGLTNLVGDIRARDVTLGRPVRVEGRHGIARGIADDGRLRVSFEDGTTELVIAGDVELTIYGS